MKNIDKIKALNAELRQSFTRSLEIQGEVNALKAALREAELTTERVLAGLTLKYGAQVGADAWELILPATSEDYGATIERGVIRVERHVK